MSAQTAERFADSYGEIEAMREELKILIKAQYPLIYLVTPEEERAETAIAEIAQQERPLRRVFVWTVTHGLVEHGHSGHSGHNNTSSPEMAIQRAIGEKDPALFIFKDLHPFLTNAAVVRWLRDAVLAFKGSSKSILFMSPTQQIPIELESDVVVLDFPMPTLSELGEVLSAHIPPGSPKLSIEARAKLLKASLGLTRDEAEKVYQKAKAVAGKLTESELDIILSEKKQLIRRNGILEFLEEDETMDSIGGLEELKRWLTQRTDAFTDRAHDYGLPEPKGMLILGVPGCGKSLIAKTTSRLWGMPLLRLDMGRVYDGSTVGRSEANLRSALKTAESIAPAILFIDEMDKAFAGNSGSADSDGGTSSRIFGSFLTWMQEKKSSVFVMATANRVERLPGEFLRKGRFDEIFFVDLPTQEERQEIFRIHLSKRRADIERFDVEQLANVCDGFSGAEIEQVTIAAMYEAFAQDREFTQLDIIAASRATMPLSKTMTEQVTALRDWARQRARPAAASVAEYQRLEF
jgi:SpoVK/Ycf46/Vps4 family AAA+-type ATPase